MNITEIAVRRPVTILMIVLGLVVMGAISYGLLPVRELPNVRYPYLQVTVNDPGADPQDVRLSVTDPLENALTSVNGVTSMTSVSMQGVSEITIQLASGISLGTAANDVAQALHSVARKLPTTASLPSITETNPATMPIMNLSLSGKLSQTQLYTLAQNTIVPAIESVPGVGSVNVQGGLIPQVNVQVHESALLAYGVTLPQIRQALIAQNATVPSGAINNGSQTYTVSTNTPYTSIQSLGNVVITAAAPRGGKAPAAGVAGASAGAGGAGAGGGAATGAGTAAPAGGTGTAGAAGAAGTIPQTRSITLGQIANITQGYATPVTINRINGKTAIGLSIDAQSNANSLSVESGVLHVLQTLKKTLPPGAALNVIADTTVYTRAALSAVLRDLVLAVALASAVLYLFLRRLSHTIIVLCAIPASLIATFTVMYAFGFSLDLMSMLALSLLIGILVDDSIVVLENIDRHLSLGADPKTAAIRGRMEIGAAAVAITLTDVVVYVPIVFVHGTVGQLFREFGVTIVAATLFSLFVSFTLTPMLASRWLRTKRNDTQAAANTDLESGALPSATELQATAGAKRRLRFPRIRFPAWERLTSSLPGRYERLIRLALRHRLRVIAIGLSALALSACFVSFGWVGTAFVPQENPQVIRIAAQMPTGTSLQTTDAAMRVFSAKIRKIPAIQAVFATAGNSLAGLTATNDAVLTVVRSDKGLTSGAGKTAKGKGKTAKGKGGGGKGTGGKAGGGKKGRRKGLFPSNGISLNSYQSAPLPPLAPLLARVSAIAQTIPGLQIQTDVPNPLVVSGSEPISVIVSGPNTTVLQALAAKVQGALTQIPSLTNIQNQTAANLPIWLIHVNNQAAAQLGVNALMVGQAAQTAIGGAVASTLQSPGGGIQTNIMVSLNHGSSFSPAQMAAIPIARRGTQMTTLGEVATVSLVPGPVSLNESNRQLTAIVTAGTTNPALGVVAQQVKAAVTGLALPPGYSVSLGGEIAQQTQAFGPLLQAFILSVALVYMLMAALYESLVMPLVVLFSLPMATVGAFLGLWLTGQTLNIFSFMAMIMLMGLVAKNAILLVDYTGQLVKKGMPRSEALVLAGKTRLRPIVMTTATMVFSMIPLALHTGIGSSDRIPIAVVLIGGLTTSTLLTLVVVPVLYTYMDDFRQWLLQFRRTHSAAPGPAPSATQGGSP
ncbi:MAG: efflux RND transporter permease subunit [Bacilli bacterium]